MTAAERAILKSIIKDEAECWENQAGSAADAILAAGFSMASRPVDDDQNKRLDEIDRKLSAIYGWTGLPT